MERKALTSLFSFLYQERLWCENPLNGVKHIGPRWGERERRCPSVDDVGRVMEAGFMRAQDALKMRTVVILLGDHAGYDNIGEEPPIFSPDSQRVVYAAQVGNKWLVVVDGVEGKHYDSIMAGTPIFSPEASGWLTQLR